MTGRKSKRRVTIGATRRESQPIDNQGDETMFGSITTFQVQSGKLDEVIRLWSDSIMPEVRHQKGFKSAKLFTDRTTGKCAIVGEWETEAEARVFQTGGEYQKQVAKMAALLAVSPVREVFEISA